MLRILGTLRFPEITIKTTCGVYTVYLQLHNDTPQFWTKATGVMDFWHCTEGSCLCPNDLSTRFRPHFFPCDTCHDYSDIHFQVLSMIVYYFFFLQLLDVRWPEFFLRHYSSLKFSHKKFRDQLNTDFICGYTYIFILLYIIL